MKTYQERIAELLPVLKEIAEGEELQFRAIEDCAQWRDFSYVSSLLLLDAHYEFRVKPAPVVLVEYMNVYRYGENGFWYPRPMLHEAGRTHLVTIKRTTIDGVVQPLEFLP